jgi:hypothetical protein
MGTIDTWQVDWARFGEDPTASEPAGFYAIGPWEPFGTLPESGDCYALVVWRRPLVKEV